MAACLGGFDWALNWSLQPLSIAPVCNVTFGYKANTISLREGGGASESAFEWLQLNQNKERLIARWVLWKDWAEAIKQKDFQHLHQWHLSEQIFTVYYNYWYLLRLCTEKTIQMLTGKTAFPYQSYQWRPRIGHFVTVLNVREVPGAVWTQEKSQFLPQSVFPHCSV